MTASATERVLIGRRDRHVKRTAAKTQPRRKGREPRHVDVMTAHANTKGTSVIVSTTASRSDGRLTTSASVAAQARLSRNVGQPDHILANPIVRHQAERRPGSGEIWLAVTKHDGVQVDSILIDQAKFGEAVRQVRASNFDLPVALGLQLADRALEIILNKPGVGADRLQRARDDPFRLVPPRRREGVFRLHPIQDDRRPSNA